MGLADQYNDDYGVTKKTANPLRQSIDPNELRDSKSDLKLPKIFLKGGM